MLPRSLKRPAQGPNPSLTGPMSRLPTARRFSCVLVVLSAAAPRLALAEQPSNLDLKPGQEITFPVTVADGRITLGPPRLTKPGAAQPKDGEVTVAVVKHGLSPYADLTVTEKTSQPVDFVATGLIGDIKIDEIVVCGRLDAPAVARIASGSWRVSLNRFAVRAIAGAPTAGEGGLGCPR